MANTYIRPKDKIEKYLDTLAKKYGSCTVSAGLRSRYYSIDNKVLRISDHIGAHNDAHMSIIVPSFRSTDQQYIVHAHNCGQISIVPYDKAKELVRSFFYLSAIFGEVIINRDGEIGVDKEEKTNVDELMKKLHKLEDYRNKAISKEKMILGLPMDSFQKGQLKTILNVVNKVKRTLLENK
jgi:hypothetical protein